MNRLPKEVVDSPSLGVFQNHGMWFLETCFSGGLGRTGLTVGLHDLEDLFQPSWFCDSVTSKIIKPMVVSRNLQVGASWGCRCVCFTLSTSQLPVMCHREEAEPPPIYIMMLLICYISTSLNHPAGLLKDPFQIVSCLFSHFCFWCLLFQGHCLTPESSQEQK